MVMKRWIIFFLFLVLGQALQAKTSDQPREFFSHEREILITLLEGDGFERDFLREVFWDQRLEHRPSALFKNIHHKENPRDYSDFTKSYSIHLAKRFQRRWVTELKRASHKYQVDKEVLVAILLVETGLGNILGNYPVISVFSSILVEHEKCLSSRVEVR